MENTDTIGIGSKITLFDVEYDEEIEYKIVDIVESDPINGLVSCDSPIGSALMGKRSGDEIEVKLPFGKAEYKIIEVN